MKKPLSDTKVKSVGSKDLEGAMQHRPETDSPVSNFCRSYVGERLMRVHTQQDLAAESAAVSTKRNV